MITLREVVPELPALRSCVERLWRKSLTTAALSDVEDLMRFDEAMDLADFALGTRLLTWAMLH